MSDADGPGVVGAAVVQRVDPNLAAAAPPLESAAAASLAAAAAIRISCFGKEGIREWRLQKSSLRFQRNRATAVRCSLVPFLTILPQMRD